MHADSLAIIGSDAIDRTYRYPFPPFPNGWFPVEVSCRLAPGQLIEKHVLGTDVVIYRTESGIANVIDAYCPHLGSHIGKGGAVVGERIRCPFHHWEFELDGRCGHAFAAKKVPDAAVPRFETVEKNGNIFIWVDQRGRAPTWQIPDLPETQTDDYVFVGFKDYSIRTHPQEMFENLVDFLHFKTVHRWSPDNFQWHCEYGSRETSLDMDVSSNDDAIKTTSNVNRMLSTSCGPSYNYTRYFGAFRGVATLMFCPTRPGVLTSYLLFWAHRSIPAANAAAWMEGYLRDYTLDIDILENKKYLQHPKMSDADGPINKMRKWYRQWYE